MDGPEREGGDITAAHMVHQIAEPSQIKRYFQEATVFVTGATGFLGKLLVEKLLRLCPDVKRVYVMMRDGPSVSSEEKFEAFFDSELFNRLKRENVRALRKVTMMKGDCTLPNLGLDDANLEVLLRDVNCVFHCASTMKLNEKLSTASLTNVGATKELIKLARKMHNLRSIVYISTAFCVCSNKVIKEDFYEPAMTGDDLLTLIDILTGDILDAITPTLMGAWSSTYTFTKAIAEEIIRREGDDLPIAIVRPSIVVGTVKEPVAGWVQNKNGLSGVIVGVSLGYIRTLQCKMSNVADMVPADHVINCMLAAAWDIAMRKGSNTNHEIALENCNVAIYNYVSTPEKPLRWSTCTDLVIHHFLQIPLSRQVWHVIFAPRSGNFAYSLLHCLLHLTPAALIDAIGHCIGRNYGVLRKYGSIGDALNGFAHFTSREWHFNNDNTCTLWTKMNSEDRRFFEFSMESLDWDLYFHTYVRGLRVYLLGDHLDTIPAARVKRQKLKTMHYFVLIVVGLMALLLLY